MYLGLRATICSYRKKTVIILLLYFGVLQEIWADIVIKTGWCISVVVLTLTEKISCAQKFRFNFIRFLPKPKVTTLWSYSARSEDRWYAIWIVNQNAYIFPFLLFLLLLLWLYGAVFNVISILCNQIGILYELRLWDIKLYLVLLMADQRNSTIHLYHKIFWHTQE